MCVKNENKPWHCVENEWQSHKVVCLSRTRGFSSREGGRVKVTEGDVKGQTALLTHSVMCH